MVANFISRELARGEAQAPTYTPYISDDAGAAPWHVTADEHSMAITKWPTNGQARQADRPQKLHFRAWLMYRISFIFTADICGAWLPFGRISAHMNNVSALLRPFASQSPKTSPYLLLTTTPCLPNWMSLRERAEWTFGAADFADLLPSGHARFKAHAVAQCAKPAVPPVKVTNAWGPPPVSKTGAPKRVWRPRMKSLGIYLPIRRRKLTELTIARPNRGSQNRRPLSVNVPARPSLRRRSHPADTRTGKYQNRKWAFLLCRPPGGFQ